MKKRKSFPILFICFVMTVFLMGMFGENKAGAASELPMVLSNANYVSTLKIGFEGTPRLEAQNMKLGEFVNRVFANSDTGPQGGTIKAYVIMSGYGQDTRNVVFVDDNSILCTTSGVVNGSVTMQNSEAYMPFRDGYNTISKIALVFGERDNNITSDDYVYLVNIDRVTSPEFIVAAYDNSGTEKIVASYSQDKAFKDGDTFIFGIADDSWSDDSVARVVLGFSGKDSDGLTAKVYSGYYESADAIPSSAADITDEVWRGTSKTDLKKGLEVRGNEKTPITIVLKRNDVVVDVLARYVGVQKQLANITSTTLWARKPSYLYYGTYSCSESSKSNYEIDGHKYILKIFNLRRDYTDYETFRLRIYVEKGKLKDKGSAYIEKAVLGRYDTLEEASGVPDIKDSIFVSASDYEGVDLEPGKDYVFTIFFKDGQIAQRAFRLEFPIIEGPKITKQPANVIVRENSEAIFTLSAKGSGNTYSWWYQLPGRTEWFLLSESGSAYAKIPYQASKDGMKIRCTITGEDGGVTTSDTAVLRYAFGNSVIIDSRAFPDQRFMAYISSQFDSDGDSIITEAEVANINTITCGGRNITSLAGIELFPNLEYLYCKNNKIEYLDIGKNPNLRYLEAQGNKISTLDISYNPILKNIFLTCGKRAYEAGEYSYVSYFGKQGNKDEGFEISLNTTVIVDRSERLSIIKQPEDTYCENGNVAGFAIAATGKGLTYQWQYKTVAGGVWMGWSEKNKSVISVPYTENYKDGLSLRCIVTDEDGNKLTSKSAVLRYASKATIISDPASVIVTEGEMATFSVKAEGVGLKYLWQYKYADDSTWTDWTSKTTSSISVAYASYRQGMTLRCLVTDAIGTELISGRARLTYDKAIRINNQPSSITVTAGTTAGFSVRATGNELKYLWQYKKKGDTKWTDWTSKTTASITVAYADYRDGMSLRCVITDRNGIKEISKTVTLTYKSTVSISRQPVSVTVTDGEIAYMEVQATGKDPEYLWQYKTAGSDSWTDWASKTTAEISIAYAAYRNGMSFRCLIKDSYGKTVVSDAAVLTYVPIFTFTKQPADSTVKEGELAYFEVGVKGKGLKYLWQYFDTGKSTWVNWDTKTTAKISVAYASYRNGMSLRCVITDVTGRKLVSNLAKLTYVAPITITKQPVSVTVEKNSLASFSVSASGEGLKYLWQYKNVGDPAWTDWNTKTTASITVAYASYRNGMSLRCIITDAKGNKLTSDAVKLNYK